MANQHMKRCSASLVIMESQMNSSMKCHFTLTGRAEIKKTISIMKNVEILEPSYFADRNVKQCSYLGKEFGGT